MQTKHLFLTAILLVFSMLAVAGPVDPMRALEVAEQFAPQQAKGKGIKSKTAPEQSYEIVYTHRMPNSDCAAFYVVKLGEKGFVIISADDVANPILGYSYTNSWPTSISAEGDTLLPPQVLSFLNNMALQIETAIEKYPNLDSSDEWNNVGQKAVRKTSARKSADALPDSVGPLLTTTWGQGQYYNALCPEDAEGEDGHVPTGCVATAMAQIINYWGQKEEIKTRGIHSYDSQYGNLTVNYDSTSYDFANMPDALTAESTPEQINAVAKLMYECGVAVNMQYSAWESGAVATIVAPALVDYFRLNPKLGEALSSYYTGEQWLNLIKTNISNNQPVLYAGGAHLYIIDGYNSDFYHLNLGWDGNADGWYLLDTIYDYTALLDIYPDSGSNIILGQAYGNSTYQVDSNMHFKYIYAENIYPHYVYTGGASPQVVTFSLQDTLDRIVVDVMAYNNDIPSQNMIFYDGADTSSPILRMFLEKENNDLSPIITTGHQITIDYTCVYADDGFHLRVGKKNDCRLVSDIIVKELATDTKEISWTENGTSSQWVVEYGPEGFAQGEGVSIKVDRPFVIINNLSPEITYEIRIRSVCDSNDALWKNVIVNRQKYWTDIITSEPEGYHVDLDGIIHISSPEGLAWLAKIVQQDGNGLMYEKTNLVIENDINLEKYLWRPIPLWRGNIDGGGHLIANMTVHEMSDGGLFCLIEGDTVKDIGFINASVEGSSAGTIASSVTDNTTLINCYSINHSIKSSAFYAGGLINGSPKMYNCFAIGDIASAFGGGGLVGGGNPKMYNCYSNIFKIKGINCWKGLISSYTSASLFDNCFANIDHVKDTWSHQYVGTLYEDPTIGYFFGHAQNLRQLKNVVAFSQKRGETILVNDTAINCTYPNDTKLLDALNSWVNDYNDPNLKKWIWDSILNCPVHGDYYEPLCPNVSGISLKNIKNKKDYAVVISWIGDEVNTEWQIKCISLNESIPDSIVVNTSCNTDTLYGLQLGTKYRFYVRAICSADKKERWGAPVDFIFDKPYWTEIVTTCPDGYIEKDDGMIIISSPEGLAWLSVCSNGLNGQNKRSYENCYIRLDNNIDLESYRWLSISKTDSYDNIFRGNFDGNGFVISNLYINGPEDTWNGLFGSAINATIRNVILQNVNIIGWYNVGSLIGNATDCIIDNCHAHGIVKGVQFVGGLIGQIPSQGNNALLSNSSMSGNIYGNILTGGLVGLPTGAVKNCYSNANIHFNGNPNDRIGGLFGGHAGEMDNCYTSGSVDIIHGIYGNITSSYGIYALYPDAIVRNMYALSHNNGLKIIGDETWGSHIISDTASFNAEGMLTTSVSISNSSYTNLLDALNAWVDANNSEGQYLHWVADTANVNGGYPTLKQEPIALPKYIITFCNDDGTVLQQDTLELGTMPLYRGEIPIKETEYAKYSFTGWSPTLHLATENITYIAQYTEMYEVTFYNWDGTLLQSAWYNYGEYPSYNGETPTHEADAQYTYTFSGWSPQLDWVSGNQAYYAQYESTLNQYEINFYDWDGTLLQSNMVNYGEWPMYYNSDPWREADAQYTYTFIGWSPQLDWVSGNQAYYAQYESTLNQYEINFYNWDGTLLQSEWLNYGEWPNYYNSEPTREADAQYTYTFTGWSPQLDWVSGNQAYYAQYEATLNQYEVTFYDWDGTLLQSEWVNYGEWPTYYNSDPWREADAQYTYTFTGWSPQLDWVSGNQAYYAQYESTLNKYEINFYNWDGTLLQSSMVNYGEWPAYYNSDPWRESDVQYTYTFTGWSPELDMVTGHQSYYAQYESTLNQYEISFYNWDGTLLQSNMVNYGEWPNYYNSEPTRDADAQYTYTFTGWSPELDMVTGHQSYYAQYDATLNQYEITFYDWDGELLYSDWVNYGAYPHYGGNVLWREADAQYTYTFTGWSPELSVVTGNQSYTAQYEATLNQYEVAFYDWDGTLLQSTMVNYGEWPTYYNSDPWRESDAQYTYTFTGWNPQLDWVTSNQSYYAQYESTLNQYEINFYDWDGTLLQSNMVNYGEWPMYYNSDPWRDADAQYTYTFIGWNPELSIVTGHQSYYAQYEATLNQYEITFLNWDGEVLQSTMVDYGAMPEYFGVTPTKPEDEQYVYTFSGWEPEITIVVAYAEYTAQYDATDKVTTVIENTQSDEVKTYKILRNNKIFIIRGDKVYSILGHVIEDWMPLGL